VSALISYTNALCSSCSVPVNVHDVHSGSSLVLQCDGSNTQHEASCDIRSGDTPALQCDDSPGTLKYVTDEYREGAATQRIWSHIRDLNPCPPAFPQVLYLTELMRHSRPCAVAILAYVLLLSGCAKKPPVAPQIVRVVETVEVKVPTLVQRVPPAELLAPLAPPLPVFVAPESPDASSALTAEGERLLRALIEDLLTRIEAWKAWAQTPETTP
jgi:hypothetical protein